MKLTERSIAALTVEGDRKDRLVFDDVTPGLGVRVSATGKTFIAQYTISGRKRRVSLGRWGALTLDKARDAAKTVFGDVARGTDVAAQRTQTRLQVKKAATDAKLTLDVLIQSWTDRSLSNARESHRRYAPMAIRSAFAKQLGQPASALRREKVVEILDGIVKDGRPVMAARTLAYGRACYSWARKRGSVAENPFADLPAPAAAVARDRVLSDSEVAAIWTAAGSLSYPFGPLFKLLLLTGQRRDEVAGMRWAEFSADLAVWTIPKERAKNRRAHVVHLAPAAQAILATVPKFQISIDGKPAVSEFVFTTTGKTRISGFSRPKARLEEKANEVMEETLPEWHLHDFRRTMVTWLAGAGVPPHVCDRLLNHVTGSIQGVAAVYQRQEFLPERKAALERWAGRVAGR
jgi:integrase